MTRFPLPTTHSLLSLSTCDIPVSNLAYVGFKPTILAFSFCSLHPTNKILKKTSMDLCSFLGFNSDGRPIKFQIHSCKGIIAEANTQITVGPPAFLLLRKSGGQSPLLPPPMANRSRTTGSAFNIYTSISLHTSIIMGIILF